MSEPIEVNIEFPYGVTVSGYKVTPLGVRHYQLEDDPLSCVIFPEEELADSPNSGDIIEAEIIRPGVLKYLGIFERSPYRKYSYVLTPEIADSEDLKSLLVKIESLGGEWERIFGGMLLIHIPKNIRYSPQKEIKALIEKFHSQ